jgi:hypothetical protein
MYEFAPDSLGARDFAGFYELEGQYLEIRFDDGACESHLLWLISSWLILIAIMLFLHRVVWTSG